MSIPDLNPPTKTAKAEKKAKAPKAEKPEGEKKERAPRQNYGFHPEAVIAITEKEGKFRGQRAEWYEVLKGCNGKKVADFLEAAKDKKDPPRGWLRFFVQEGFATLSGAPEAK